MTVSEATKVEENPGVYDGRTKLGARVQDSIKMRLKIASALTKQTEESIVEAALEKWLDEHNIPKVN